MRKISAGSESESESDTVRVTSHIFDATQVWKRPSRSSVRSARGRDIDVISIRSNSLRRAAIRSSGASTEPMCCAEPLDISVPTLPGCTNNCSVLIV